VSQPREGAGAALDEALAATSIIVPAYNEAGAIEDVLDDLAALRCRVVVVDDGSSDATSRLCLRRPVAVLRHPVNLGAGAALQTGITYALRQQGVRFLVTFDADGQHHADDVASLVAELLDGRYDVALGSRFLTPAGAATMPRGRKLLLRLATLFTRYSTGLRTTDTHNGLRAITAQAAAGLRIRHCGMAHASEIMSWIHREGLRWCEVPVTITYSPYSLSKGQRGTAAVDIVWDLVTGRMR
jgi:glycosyltransferase involved in cell wall biosynthesis